MLIDRISGLNAINGDLHYRIEVLYTNAYSVDAELCETVYTTHRQFARVDLDREVLRTALLRLKVGIQPRKNLLELIVIEERWRAATEVKLFNAVGSIDQFAMQLHFPQQPLHVRICSLQVSRTNFSAGTVVTNC